MNILSTSRAITRLFKKTSIALSMSAMTLLLTVSTPLHADPIHDAVLANDLAKVKSLIKSGADVNALDFYGFSPLLIARIKDYNDIASALNSADAKSQVNEVARRAQNRLWGLGYIESRPDGVLGEGTRAAIRKFQQDNGLKVSGRVTPEMMEVLDQKALAKMQTLLKKLNLYNDTIDGLRGRNSTRAIYAAQAKYGVKDDDILSAELFSKVANAAGQPIVADTKPAETKPDAEIKTDTTTAENTPEASAPELGPISVEFIQSAQTKLTWLGFDTSGTDGKIGPKTMAALENFAIANNLEKGKEFDQALMGMVDDAVNKRVQEHLDKLGYDVGPADGLLGQRTIDAIKKYQAEKPLPVDGQINTQLLASLSDSMEKLTEAAESENEPVPELEPIDESIIINAQQKLNWLGYDTRGVDGKLGNSTIKALEQFAKTVDIKDPDLKDDALIGALDNAVNKRVQTALTNLGYQTGPADGLLGGQSRNAIREFEKKSGLRSTGEVSGALLTKLTEAATKKPFKSDPDVIREVQAKLTTMGFDTKGIDGKPGGQTTRAIKEFQKYRKVPQTGEVTPGLLAMIDETLLDPPKRKEELTRDQVINMQRALNSLGYQVGVPDGKIGNKTHQALKGFLAAEGMDTSTEPNRLLLSLLLARAAPKIADIRQTGGQTAPASKGGSGVATSSGRTVGATEVSGRIRFHRSGGQLVGCSIAGVQVGADWCRTFSHVKNTSNCKLSVRANGQPLYIRCR